MNDTNDPIGEYLVGLRLLEDVAGGVDVVVPGHGSAGDAEELRARIESDRAYVVALSEGRVPSDRRVGETAKPGWEWTSDISAKQVRQLSERSRRGGVPG